MANLLFDVSLGSFNLHHLPKELTSVGSDWDKWPNRTSERTCVSEYQVARSPQATFHSDAVIAALMMASEDDALAFRPGSGVVKVTDAKYICEYHHQDGSITFVLYDNSTGAVRAGIQYGDGVGAAWAPFPVLPNTKASKDKKNMLPFFMAIAASMCDRQDKKQFGEDIDLLKRELPIDANGYDVMSALYRISDAMYFGLKDGAVLLALPSTQNIDKLDQQAILNGAYSGKIIWGEPAVLKKAMGSAPKAAAPRASKSNIKSFKQMPEVIQYVKDKCSHWSDEEKAMIPSFPDNTMVPEEVGECIQAIIGSVNCKRPIVQLGWRGTSAYGKSTGVEMLACILNKPLLRFTCSSTTEKQDFLTQIMPDTSKSVSAASVSFDEIACDPEGTYERLTGKIVANISCDEVFQEAVRQMAAGVSTTPRYVMQESTYIRALKHGYIVEVQESSRIRDAGVLPGLNEYDRPGALIPQADGSFCRRHPDAIVFFTDNVGYRSCNDLDPSVIRRIAFFINSTDLPKAKAMARIKSNTNDPALVTVSGDSQLMGIMYTVWKKVKEYCEKNDLLSAGGCVTIEELERWVQMTAIMGRDNIRKACQYCIINKATTDDQEQEDILTTVVIPELSKANL